MPAYAGNALTLAIGKQSAKGTPQTTPQTKMAYTGGFGPTPDRATIVTAETDASRMAGDPLVVGLAAQGTAEHYLRPNEHHYLAHSLLGQTTTTGAGPYTHTATSTASGSAPYYTLYRATQSTVEVTRMSDMQISTITWAGSAGQPISVSADWVGGTSLLGQTDPVTAMTTGSPLVYPHVTITKGGVHDGSVGSFSITATQNRTPYTGDSGLSAFDVVPGLYAVTGELTLLFQSDADYRLFYTGSTSGTTPGITIGTQALSIAIVFDATQSVTLTFANIISTGYEPNYNTDGSPLVSRLAFQSQKSATLGNVLTVATVNTITSV